MADANTLASTPLGGKPPVLQSYWRVSARRFLRHRLAVAGGVAILLLALASTLAPWIAPYPFQATDVTEILHASKRAALAGDR